MLRSFRKLTNTVSSIRFAEDSRKTKIADLHLALVAINEDVITLEVSMNHRRIKAMKIEEPFQDLPTPMFDCSNVNFLVF